jgi:hypothetical protein
MGVFEGFCCSRCRCHCHYVQWLFLVLNGEDVNVLIYMRLGV